MTSVKTQKYQEVLAQVSGLVAGEVDEIANMANIAAVLKSAFDFHWVGFYRLHGEVLVLGPFQGPVACTRIPFGKGVCGHAAQLSKTVIVPDVHRFSGHIACSALSNSEIVVPMIRNRSLVAVLDIDSVEFDYFDSVDQHFLEVMMR